MTLDLCLSPFLLKCLVHVLLGSLCLLSLHEVSEVVTRSVSLS
uniref:Uncharacterized protein n=1 Tax=Rhizophora mucronata TaxID=61149 RepID=A0A2P2P6S5_RHIMU